MCKGFIRTRFDICTGCSLCQLSCSNHLFSGFNPNRSVLRIEHRRENLYHLPIVCAQCENAYCANVCPFKAIEVDEKTGARIVKEEKCDGCGLCIQYCPTEMIFIDPESEKAIKCDLCQGDPECVKICPTDALSFISLSSQNPDDKNEGDRNG